MSPQPAGGPARGRFVVGCAGYDYDDWRGRFYPVGLSRQGWFAHYASRFETVELNSTFYGLPSVATFDTWRTRAPEGFVYAVKLSRYGSHFKRLRDPQGWLTTFVDRVEHLGPCLGPVLVQLPPRWHADPQRLDQFLQVAPRHLRWAVELRDPSWLCDEVFAVLQAHRAALCLHDLVPDHPRIATADWVYLRFHGPDAIRARYAHRYGAAGLRGWSSWLRAQLDEGFDVYAYFNNDIDGAAVEDAATLSALLRGGDQGPGLGHHDAFDDGTGGPLVRRRMVKPR